MGITINDMIDGFDELDLGPADKLYTLCQLMDLEKIAQSLSKSAMMVEIGMDEFKPQDELAYLVISIVRPELIKK